MAGRPAEKGVRRRGEIGAGVRRGAGNGRHIVGVEPAEIFAQDIKGGVFALHGVYAPPPGGHCRFDGDAARARADVPDNGVFAQREL